MLSGSWEEVQTSNHDLGEGDNSEQQQNFLRLRDLKAGAQLILEKANVDTDWSLTPRGRN